MIDRDRLSLGHLLDAMDDHYDQRISDEQFVLQAASAQSSLDPAATGDPDMAPGVRALEDFVKAARDGTLPPDLYEALRLELANLPPPPGWRAYGPWRTFSLRVLRASWGIAIDFRARSAHCDTFPLTRSSPAAMSPWQPAAPISEPRTPASSFAA